MGPETLAAIAAVASAAIAVGSAISAKRSADRSAAAEERSAKAAEETVAIERKRLAHELDARAEATAPKVDVGEENGLCWVLAQRRRALVGYVENHGPGGAVVESIVLRGPDGGVEIVGVNSSWEGLLAAHETQQVQARWPFEDVPTEPLVVTVTYRAARGPGYRAEARVTLHRDGADANGQPMWRSGETKVRRL